jgi:hypothetical protein
VCCDIINVRRKSKRATSNTEEVKESNTSYTEEVKKSNTSYTEEVNEDSTSGRADFVVSLGMRGAAAEEGGGFTRSEVPAVLRHNSWLGSGLALE